MYPHCFSHLIDFLSPHRWRERVYPHCFSYLTDGEKECTPLFLSPHRWRERVYPHCFSHLIDFLLPHRWRERVYPHCFSHLTDGEKECTPTVSLTSQMERKSVPPLFLSPHRWGVPPTVSLTSQMGCTPHCFSPPYTWRKAVYPPPTVSPHLWVERESELHSFSPLFSMAEIQNVSHTVFPPCNKIGKKNVPLHYFFHLHSFSSS